MYDFCVVFPQTRLKNRPIISNSDRKPGVGVPGAPRGPNPGAGAGVGPGDFTCQKPGAGGFLL